jgi:hypothetical protein
MTSPIKLTELQPAEFRSAIEPLVAVYVPAIQSPLMLAGREAILEWHAANPGFRALAALTPHSAPSREHRRRRASRVPAGTCPTPTQ